MDRIDRIRFAEPRWLAASVSALLLFGCNRHDVQEDDHHHGDEPKTAQITVWGERHEIFIEHRFVVVNTATKFVTHITDLKTLEPRREGPVKFMLRQANDTPIEQTEKEPTRAGIYEAMLQFPKAGDWNVTVSIPFDEGEKTITLPTIKVFATKHEADHGQGQEAPEGITFLKEQQWKVLSKAEPVTKRRLVERVRVPAMVTARPGSLAQVMTPIAGKVLPLPGKPLPTLGDRVEKGQTLALLQPSFSELAVRFTEAEAEVTRSRLAVEQAELSFKRIEKLAAAEAKSGRELQEADFALKSAQARLNAALALQATYRQASANQTTGSNAPPAIELKSSIAGVITDERRTPDGEHVATDTLLFTVLDTTSVFIDAKVPEASVARLSSAKGANYELPGEAGTFRSITDGAGRLVFIGLQVDPATRTVPLIYEVKNTNGALRVGQFLNLHVETQRAENTLAIPDSAVVEESGQPVAFVQVGGETFQKRELTLGIRDGNWVQVSSGLSEGERVVTKGAMAIRLASASSVIPAHGHAH